MPDTATGHPVPVTPDAAETAVRAALRISARNGCALTRDAAEQIAEAVLGRASESATTETEWGLRQPSGIVVRIGSDEDVAVERVARMLADDHAAIGNPGALHRRAVTYGPWEEVR